MGLSSWPAVSDRPPHVQGFTVWEQLVALDLHSAYYKKRLCACGEYCIANLLSKRDVMEYNTGLLFLPLPPACMASYSIVMYSSSFVRTLSPGPSTARCTCDLALKNQLLVLCACLDARRAPPCPGTALSGAKMWPAASIPAQILLYWLWLGWS